jgi:hypothetical protein
MPRAYCTIADVQAELKNTDADLVPAIEMAIASASAFIVEYKGRDYDVHEFASDSPLVIRASDRLAFARSLFLPYSPVIEITSLEQATLPLVEGTDWYMQHGAKGVLTNITATWAPGDADGEEIKIVGRFGYTALDGDDFPQEIRSACAQIAAALTGHNTKDVIGLDGQRTSITIRDIPKPAQELLGSRKPTPL